MVGDQTIQRPKPRGQLHRLHRAHERLQPRRTIHKRMMIQSINPQHQSMVNKATAWMAKYDLNNDLRAKAEGIDDERLIAQYDKLCERAYNKYLEYCEELPKREVVNIEKQMNK